MSFSFTSTPSSSPPYSVADADNVSTAFSFAGGGARAEPEAPRVAPFSFMAPSSANPPASLKKPAKANRVTADDDEAEGSVTFPSRAKGAFRYRLTVRDDKVALWIEDKRSKQQWQSSALALCEFVPTDRVIPMATLKDYVECFKSCLTAELNGGDGDDKANAAFQRDLVPDDHGSDLKLIFTLRIQMLASVVLTPSYEFVLRPVALSEVDILSAKVRDQEDEIARLRAQVDALIVDKSVAQMSAVHLRAETMNDVWMNQKLIWTPPLASHSCWKVRTDGAITFTREGLYMVQVVVHHTNKQLCDPRAREKPNDAFQLRKNDITIATCRDASIGGADQWSQLHHIVSVKKNDSLTISYSGTGVAYSGSYIIVYQLQ